MKKLGYHIAFIASLLAGLRLLLEQLIHAGLIEETGLATGWMDALMHVALTPLPVSNFLILVVSLSVLGILLVLGGEKPRSQRKRPKPLTPSHPPTHKTPQPLAHPLPTNNAIISQAQVDEEWCNLEEADQEVIREMMVQEGLWESDMVALLQVRGLRAQPTRGESLADRVSFVQCDYAGHYSIRPEFRVLLENILAAEYAEETR